MSLVNQEWFSHETDLAHMFGEYSEQPFPQENSIRTDWSNLPPNTILIPQAKLALVGVSVYDTKSNVLRVCSSASFKWKT